MGTSLLTTWQRLSRYPGGKKLFSIAAARAAPYFKTVSPVWEELRENYSRVLVRKHRAVENHIGTVHAIAVCNGLEAAMGICCEASCPRHLRWIPKGLNVEYTSKADTDIHAIAEITEPWEPGEIVVHVTATAADGRVVAKGVIPIWVSAKDD